MSMWEAPDSRIWPTFGPLLAFGFVHVVGPDSGPIYSGIEILLYFTCIIAGLHIGVMSVRSRYSLLHPSINRDDSPIMFWLEIGGSCAFCSAMGVWKLGHYFL